MKVTSTNLMETIYARNIFASQGRKRKKNPPFFWTHVLRMQISRSTYGKGHTYTAMYTRRKYKFGTAIESTSNFQLTNKIRDQSNSLVCFITDC